MIDIILIFALSFFGAIIILNLVFSRRDREDIIDHTRDRTFLISITIEKKYFIYSSVSFDTGNGFLFRDRYLLTNYHVIEEYAENRRNPTWNKRCTLEITDYNEEPVRGDLVVSDKKRDLAIIRLDEPMSNPLKLSRNIKPGDDVMALALSNSEEIINVTYGKANYQYKDDDDNNMISTNLHIPPGFSGSALINRNGEVVGVNSVSYGPENHLSGAITVDEIDEFLNNVSL